eukprot:3938181-Rhodomonas_salina.6
MQGAGSSSKQPPCPAAVRVHPACTQHATTLQQRKKKKVGTNLVFFLAKILLRSRSVSDSMEGDTLARSHTLRSCAPPTPPPQTPHQPSASPSGNLASMQR